MLFERNLFTPSNISFTILNQMNILNLIKLSFPAVRLHFPIVGISDYEFFLGMYSMQYKKHVAVQV